MSRLSLITDRVYIIDDEEDLSSSMLRLGKLLNEWGWTYRRIRSFRDDNIPSEFTAIDGPLSSYSSEDGDRKGIGNLATHLQLWSVLSDESELDSFLVLDSRVSTHLQGDNIVRLLSDVICKGNVKPDFIALTHSGDLIEDSAESWWCGDDWEPSWKDVLCYWINRKTAQELMRLERVSSIHDGLSNISGRVKFGTWDPPLFFKRLREKRITINERSTVIPESQVEQIENKETVEVIPPAPTNPSNTSRQGTTTTTDQNAAILTFLFIIGIIVFLILLYYFS